VNTPNIQLLFPTTWIDYQLLDSGDGQKLERYGKYTFVRPTPQAVWAPKLKKDRWNSANGIFKPEKQESGGNWVYPKPLEHDTWIMQYKGIKFNAFTANSRHMGVFPEQASHWDWITHQIESLKHPIHVLNLFGYTGIATLIAAKAGAQVTHVDASKKIVQIAQQNQVLSGLENKPIRWIVDDVFKFVQREARRNVQYDGLILDPPKFGRGTKGEVWEFFKLMPALLSSCKQILSRSPKFIVITAYAIQSSALSLYYGLEPFTQSLRGELSCGELALREESAGRILSMAIFTRWKTN